MKTHVRRIEPVKFPPKQKKSNTKVAYQRNQLPTQKQILALEVFCREAVNALDQKLIRGGHQEAALHLL